MVKDFKCSYRLKEIELAKNYFAFYRGENRPNESVRNFMYYMIFTKNYTQVFLKWITKYLLHVECVDPLVVEEVVRKYIVLIIYCWLKETKNYEYINKQFDQILSEELSVCSLLNTNVDEDDNFLTKLYLKNNPKLYSQYIQKFKVGLNCVKNTELVAMTNLLCKDYNYFIVNHTVALSDLKTDKQRRTDQTIAETMSISKDFVDIDIFMDMTNYENYIKNVVESETPKSLKTSFLIFIDLITKNIIDNDNFDLSKHITNLETFKEGNIFTVNKNCTFFHKDGCKIKFINANGEIIKNKIIGFSYTYNNIIYELSSKGLKILSV